MMCISIRLYVRGQARRITVLIVAGVLGMACCVTLHHQLTTSREHHRANAEEVERLRG